MPSSSESQRKLFATALGQKRSGDITDTPAGKIAETMSEKKIKDFVTKEDTNLELDEDKDNLQVGVQMQDTKQHEILNKSKTKEFNDFMKRNTCKKEDEEKDKEENENKNEGIQNCEMKKGGPGSGRIKGGKDIKVGSQESHFAKPPKAKPFRTSYGWAGGRNYGDKSSLGKSSDTDFSIEFLEKKIKELDDAEELTKSKVYVQPGQKIPEGKQLIRTKEGATYYESGKTRNLLNKVNPNKTEYKHERPPIYEELPDGRIAAKYGDGRIEYTHRWKVPEKTEKDVQKSILDTPIQQAFNNYMNSLSGQESKDECIAFVNTSSPIVKITSMWDKQTNEEYPDESGISEKNLQEGAKKENIEKQPYDYTKTVYENPEAEKDKEKEEMELEKGGPGSGPKYGKAGVPASKTAPALKEWDKYSKRQYAEKNPGPEKGSAYANMPWVKKSEKLYAFNDYVQKEMPIPPRQGLVFNRQSHRWERPQQNILPNENLKASAKPSQIGEHLSEYINNLPDDEWGGDDEVLARKVRSEAEKKFGKNNIDKYNDKQLKNLWFRYENQ